MQKFGIVLLTCFAFIVALCYLFTSASKSKKYLPKNETFTMSSKGKPPISLSLTSHIHAHHHTQPRSFKEIFLAFPWSEFELVVGRNLKEERLQYTKLFIDELTYFLELEPLEPINESCKAPPLPPPIETNCSLHPNAFNGVRRRQPAKIGALLQFGFDVDVLEIHMNELYDVVDVFFIIESTHAHFENIKKPLIWEHVQQQDRFTKFPVVHFIIDDVESLKATDKKWSMEALQERLRWTKFLEWNEATKYFDDEDVIGNSTYVRLQFRILNILLNCRIWRR